MGAKLESCHVGKTFSTSIYKQFCSKSSARIQNPQAVKNNQAMLWYVEQDRRRGPLRRTGSTAEMGWGVSPSPHFSKPLYHHLKFCTTQLNAGINYTAWRSVFKEKINELLHCILCTSCAASLKTDSYRLPRWSSKGNWGKQCWSRLAFGMTKEELLSCSYVPFSFGWQDLTLFISSTLWLCNKEKQRPHPWNKTRNLYMGIHIWIVSLQDHRQNLHILQALGAKPQNPTTLEKVFLDASFIKV